MLYSKKNKYHNQKIVLNGIQFDSKKEAARYQELVLLQRAGEISDLRRQVKFVLIPRFGDERAVVYYADFCYTEGGANIVEDVKSAATKKDKAYILKRKLLKYLFRNIVFREID